MQKIGDTGKFKARQNIVLKGYDPVSAGGFTQVPNFVINNPNLSAKAKLVYAKFLSYAWNNNRVFPGQERMAKAVGMSVKTLYRATMELEKSGYLEIKRRGLGKTNLYTLHHTVNKSK